MFCQEKSIFKVIYFIKQKSKKRFSVIFFIILTSRLTKTIKPLTTNKKNQIKKGSLPGFRDQ